VTEPVGVAYPPALATVIVTVVDCAVVIVAGEGETVTAGVAFAVTVTDAVPEAAL
jgi:hypothetical protein